MNPFHSRHTPTRLTSLYPSNSQRVDYLLTTLKLNVHLQSLYDYIYLFTPKRSLGAYTEIPWLLNRGPCINKLTLFCTDALNFILLLTLRIHTWLTYYQTNGTRKCPKVLVCDISIHRNPEANRAYYDLWTFTTYACPEKLSWMRMRRLNFGSRILACSLDNSHAGMVSNITSCTCAVQCQQKDHLPVAQPSNLELIFEAHLCGSFIMQRRVLVVGTSVMWIFFISMLGVCTARE